MANEILAVSARHRNPILGISSTNQYYSHNKCPDMDDFDPYFFPELYMLVGLAFTAILVEGSDLERCQEELNVFLKYRHVMIQKNSHDKTNVSMHQTDYDRMIIAIIQILQSGFSAFKKLGYPYYYDDFVWAYQRILNSTNMVFSKLKHEMQNILQIMFKENHTP